MLTNLINYIQTDAVVLGRAINHLFWDLVDEAEDTRSRFRTHLELTRTREREARQYERLGFIGFSLLREQIPVEPTPETSRILTGIEQLHAEQQRLRNLAGAKPAGEGIPFPWRRLERLLQSGEWVVHMRMLPVSSPWCGRPMNAERPAGLCLAILRGETFQPFTPDTIGAPGDLLIILAPAPSRLAWDQWILRGVASEPGDAVSVP